jgi:hypothetical protein
MGTSEIRDFTMTNDPNPGIGDDSYHSLHVHVSSGNMYFVPPGMPHVSNYEHAPARIVLRLLAPASRIVGTSFASVTFFDGIDLRGRADVDAVVPRHPGGRITVARWCALAFWRVPESDEPRLEPDAWGLLVTVEEYQLQDQPADFYQPADWQPLSMQWHLADGSVFLPPSRLPEGVRMAADVLDVGDGAEAHMELVDAAEAEGPVVDDEGSPVDVDEGSPIAVDEDEPIVVDEEEPILADDDEDPFASEDDVPVPDPFEVSEEGSPLPEGRGLVLAPAADQPPMLGGTSMLEGIRARMLDRYQEAVQQILGGRQPATAEEIVDVLGRAGLLYAVGLSLADLAQ